MSTTPATAPKIAPGPQPAAAAPKPPGQRPQAPVLPAARPAYVRRRHRRLVLSFLLSVLLPVLAGGAYLWTRAEDQYASVVAFSVRSEDVSSAVELLGGLTEMSGSSSSDTDILYEFIQSQELVATIQRKIDIAGMWSKAEGDPLFAYDPSGKIEDLVSHWQRKIAVTYDSGAGLIEVRALAFDPEDARKIATTIFEESSKMINELSDIAREDAISYARSELDRAVARLKEARKALTLFRNETQIIDPSVSLAEITGLLSNLNQQLAAALIELDLIQRTTRETDPRIIQAERRIEVIRNRIAEERRKLGFGSTAGAGGQALANDIGTYESLVVDREFAEQSYTAALAAFDSAQGEARRQSRYLAAHIKPTLAETSRFPNRLMLLSLLGLFLLLNWAVGVLIAYSLKDRR